MPADAVPDPVRVAASAALAYVAGTLHNCPWCDASPFSDWDAGVHYDGCEGVALQAALSLPASGAFIDVVFDGPPSHESGRFVEVENEAGASVRVGEWIDRGNGLWALRVPLYASLPAAREGEGLDADGVRVWVEWCERHRGDEHIAGPFCPACVMLRERLDATRVAIESHDAGTCHRGGDPKPTHLSKSPSPAPDGGVKEV